MKKNLICFFGGLLVIGCIFSCTFNNRNLQRMEEIKVHGNSNPRAALKELDSLTSSIGEETEYVRMKFDLLRLRLQDKADIIPQSDEKAKAIHNYFMENGDNREKQEASYYLASVYRDLHDTPRSLQYFLQALSLAENSEDVDSIIFTNTYSQLTSIYIFQYDNKSALEVAEKGLMLSRKLNITDPIYIMDAASAAFALEDTVKTLKYQNEALEMIIRQGQENLYADLMFEILYNLSVFEQKEAAMSCKKYVEGIKSEKRSDRYYSALAKYHMFMENTDSAIYYYKMLYDKTNRIRLEFNSTRNLSLLYEKKGDKNLANMYAQKFIEIEARHRKLLQHERAINAHNEYVYNRNKFEEARAYQAAAEAKTQKLYWILASVFFISVLLITIQIQRHKSLKQKNRDLIIINEMENEIRSNKQIIKEKESQLHDKQNRIEQTSQQLRRISDELEEKQQELSSKTKEIQEKKDLLQQKNAELHEIEMQFHEKETRLIEIMEQNDKLFRFAFTETLEQSAYDVIDKFHKAARGRHRLTDAEWKQLFSAIEKLYPKFLNAVMQKITKPTEDILRIAFLLKAGMDNPQIINLTGYPTTTVWRKVKSLKEKLGEDLLSI